MRVLKTLIIGLVLMGLSAGAIFAQSGPITAEEAEQIRKEIRELEARINELKKLEDRLGDLKEMDKRLMKAEKKAAVDRVQFTGDFRFEVHSIDANMPNHFDGMMLQNLVVNTMFYYGATGGMFPESVDQMNQFIAQNYGGYLHFTNNLTFSDLKEMMGMFPPEMQQALMGSLMPHTYVPGYGYKNDIMYTSRLRLNMKAKVTDNIDFVGRLSMYKVWGDSTGVQIFNGQSNSFNIDGNTTGIPNSNILRVERAYFTWKEIGGSGLYLSIGRRPSTDGPPMHLRNGEPRGGSPMGTLIDFQFDGITVGYKINEYSTVRLCYGMGFESGFGNGDQLQQPADRLKDAQFAGINWDIWNDDDMLIQATVARAYNLTDGFTGSLVLPDNPVTGAPIGAPMVMRYTPSANLGDMDIMGAIIMRRDGPVDWFVNYNYNKSHPNSVTTPFGGLFSDPFDTPESHSGNMIYVGARFNFNQDRTMFGLEYNKGSEYWFNFTPAQDDIIAPKTNTRGEVWEVYFIHKIYDRFHLKLNYMDYDYKYSGSGWHLGAPKKLSEMPVLGYPTYSDAKKFALTLSVRF